MAVHNLRSYDYKVYVTGPFQAGKTTMIHTLDPDTISVERKLRDQYRGEESTTTTGFDLGRVIWARKSAESAGLIIPKNEFLRERDEYYAWLAKEVELRGVPGQLHFKFVRDTMRINSNGVLLIVDSSDPAMIGDASAILAETLAAFGNLPMVVIANKQDLPESAYPFQVSTWLGVRETIGMSAKDKESCKDALILLLRKIEGVLMNRTSRTPEESTLPFQQI